MDDNDHTDAEAARREHAYEMGEESSADRAWAAYCDEIENLLGIDSLDGDWQIDGYSIDEAYGLFLNNTPVEDAAYFFRIRMQKVAAVDNFQSSVTLHENSGDW